MKYETAILKRLIDTYGVVGNPKYVSEIIKQFVIQGKECYPNLFTYQSDWLAHIDDFGLANGYVVTYTGQRFYAPNTLERPVKSAILKGQTLINSNNGVNSTKFYINSKTDFKRSENLIGKTNKTLIKPSTRYLLAFKVSELNLDGLSQVELLINNNTEDLLFPNAKNFVITANGSYKQIVTTNESANFNNHTFLIKGKGSDWEQTDSTSRTLVISDIMLIEYQDGMENWDIPYFEGMQSVKLPVLTTTNEDGTKTNILTVNEDVTLRGIGDVKDELNLMTGEVIENLFNLDCSNTDFKISDISVESTNTIRFMINNVNIKSVSDSSRNNMCNKLPHNLMWRKDEEGYYITNNNRIVVRLNKDKITSAVSREDIKNYLIENNFKFIVEKSEKSIKTVDLTIKDQNDVEVSQLSSFNGGTHFSTSSQEGSPLPVVSVSVETDLEETLKVCSLEGNTL